MPEASSYFPAVFDLSAGPVQAVQTSSADPRVRMDRTGFWSTDPSGAKVFNFDATTGNGFLSGGLTMQELLRQGGVQIRNDYWQNHGERWTDSTGKQRGAIWAEEWGGAPIPAGAVAGVARLIASAGWNSSAGAPLLQRNIIDENGGSDYLQSLGVQAFRWVPTAVIGPGPIGMANAQNVTVAGARQFWLFKASGYFTGAGGMIAWQLYDTNGAVAGQQQAQVFINEVGSHRASLFGYVITTYPAGSTQSMLGVLATGGGSRCDVSDEFVAICFS